MTVLMIYGTKIGNADEIMEMMADHLSGTCMTHIESVMKDDEFSKAVKEFGVTEDQFAKYLSDEGIYECGTCGWWTYQGEGDGTDCDDCVDDKAEEDEE
jgi:hypothetical protein